MIEPPDVMCAATEAEPCNWSNTLALAAFLCTPAELTDSPRVLR